MAGAVLAASTESGDADAIAAAEEAVEEAQASTEKEWGEAEVAVAEVAVEVAGVEVEKAGAAAVYVGNLDLATSCDSPELIPDWNITRLQV
jgi:hypothetical protein